MADTRPAVSERPCCLGPNGLSQAALVGGPSHSLVLAHPRAAAAEESRVHHYPTSQDLLAWVSAHPREL